MCVTLWVEFGLFFFFKQKTAYEMRISDWSSDVCSSDLLCRSYRPRHPPARRKRAAEPPARDRCSPPANPSAGVRSRYCQEQAHMKKSSREALDAYYAEAGSWAKDQGDALRASRRTAWWVAGGAAFLAVCEELALLFLTPLKSVEGSE